MQQQDKNNILKKGYRKVKELLGSRDSLVFLFFLILATGFWFVHSLDQQRETTLRIPIDFHGIPEDIELETELPERMLIDVRDKGSTLLKYRKKKIVPIALDVEKVFSSKGRVVITQDQLRSRLAQYVFPSTAVLSVKPDSIAFDYNRLVSKTVPVKIKGEVKLASQYILSDSLRIDPETITVYGPKETIDTLQAVYTEKFDRKPISDTTVVKMELEKSTKGIKYELNSVNITVSTEMFTENKVEVPITIINKEESQFVRLFPQNVTVTYHVGLSNFNKVRKEDIQVIFDLKEAQELGKRRYTLKLNNHSKYVSNVRISPERIEYLVE